VTDLLLVHGAWGGGWTWDPVLAPLAAAGHRARAVPQLPSSGPAADPAADLAVDAAAVRTLLDASDGEVVLVGHSYGSVVIGEVADHPAIARSVYVCGYWPKSGEQALDMGDGPPPPFMVPRADGLLELQADGAILRAAFAPDVPLPVAEEVAARMRLQSLAAIGSTATAPTRTHPTRYLVCTEDPLLPPAQQRAWAAQATSSAELPAAHLPMAVCPDLLARELTST
jgi:pimeloyl-ACP methyl ester carboxylesterase